MKTNSLLALLIVAALAACGQKNSATESVPASANTSAIVPAATAVAPAAAPAPAPTAALAPVSAADLAKGEKIFAVTCVTCHGAGVLGAPKFADKTAWQPRIAKGKDVLYNDAMNGFKMMPPRGGNAMLKDDDVKAAVDYMVSKGS